ncbi:E3 ubiquitin-protein ligase Siah1, partial [Orchesella cincta]
MEDLQCCPICFDIPEREIYQCIGGHTICHICVANLKHCPQCREPYGKKKIRNRILEQILDQQTFNCIHADEGCKEKLKRQDISKHAKICRCVKINVVCYIKNRIHSLIFSLLFRTKLLPLCKALGYRNCNFVLSQTNPKGIIKHMVEQHAAVSKASNGIRVWFTDFKSAIKSTTNVKWNPILLTVDTEWCKDSTFMVFGSFDASAKSACWTCLQLYGCSGNQKEIFEANVALLSREELEPIFKCTIPVYNLHGRASDNLMKNFPVQIPLFLFEKLCMDISNIAISVEVQPSNPISKLELAATDTVEVWTFSPDIRKPNKIISASTTNNRFIPTQVVMETVPFLMKFILSYLNVADSNRDFLFLR